MTVFNLPDLGEGLREAEIVEWHADVGDRVAAGDELVSVETEKSIVDIPSPQDGRIRRLFAAAGDIVPTGGPLVEFDDGSGTTAADSGTVVGHIDAGQGRVEEPPTEERRRRGATVKATPSVRALARQLDVDLGIVTPTGPGGTVSAEDVRRVAERFEALGPIEPLRGVRRVMALKMAQSGGEVVPAAVFDDADVDRWPGGTEPTARLLAALVAGCRAEPALNAWFDAHAVGRRVLERIDIAVAMDTPEGLFTPVVRDAGSLDLEGLGAELTRLRVAVEARSIAAREMSGYTMTLSNFGMIGGRHAVPVVMPPTVAIAGAGRIQARPVCVEGSVVCHRVMPLSLTFDHRAVTGAEAARFLAAVIADLERP